jgi:hypothetical protein
MTPARATSPALELFLSRVKGAKPCGRGYVGICEAHPDKSASLSFACGDDGRVLVHCHAGCSASAVVASLGLTLADLFPERLPPATPEARRELRERAMAADIRAAAAAMAFEALVLRVACEQVRKGVALSDADAARLDQAIERIDGARIALGPRGVARG